jgi:putative transport protein
MSELLKEQMLVLFVIMAVGAALGHITVRGISLGGAAVLAVALVFGHYQFTVPKEVRDLGLLLFVYAVGLQAGPRFFRTFRRHGMKHVVIGLASIIVGLAVAVGVAAWLSLPFDLGAGLFTGALTNTPALAAATETAKGYLGAGRDPVTAVGYGIAYPYSMIGVVVLIQVLPRLLHKRVESEERKIREEELARHQALEARCFRVTNPSADGRLVQDINRDRMSVANMSRVRHEGKTYPVTPETVIHRGDVVTAVGTPEELEKMRVLLGEETAPPKDADTNVVSEEIEVSSGELAGRSLREMDVWRNYHVVVTRIRRGDVEIAPTGNAVLDMGDIIRVVGDRERVDEFVSAADAGKDKLDETNMIPFLIGLAAGVAVGSIPVTLPSGMSVKLGASGGAFIVSLLLGHFGRVGPFRLHVPQAAKYFSRELGLMLFLAGAGTTAGRHFVEVFHQYGWPLLGAGAIVTTATVVTALALAVGVYRMRLLAALGSLAAVMTNPPGLHAATLQTKTDEPALAYASVYPVAMIVKVVAAQLLVQFLHRAV